jgi:hypothetical protein
MFNMRICVIVLGTAAIVAALVGPPAARADHKCDPVTDPGWSVVPSHETTGETDSAPYQDAAGGSWFIDRTTTMLPLCNYFDAIGNYSLRSYSLSPRITKERIGICGAGAGGTSVAIPPYAGPCPPK